MAAPSSASASEVKWNPPSLDDSLAADLRRLVSSSELHRLCASAAADRQALEPSSDKGDGIVSWGISTETQQVRLHVACLTQSTFIHKQSPFLLLLLVL